MPVLLICTFLMQDDVNFMPALNAPINKLILIAKLFFILKPKTMSDENVTPQPEAAQHWKGKAEDMLETAKDKAGDALETAKEKAEEIWGEAKDKAEDLKEAATEKIEDLAEGAKNLWSKLTGSADEEVKKEGGA